MNSPDTLRACAAVATRRVALQYLHATSEIASGSKPGIDATEKIPGEGFKRPWPPLIKLDEVVRAKVEKLLNP